MIFAQPGRAVPPEQFAEKIGHAGTGVLPAKHDNALAQHRGFLHRAPPQSGPEAGTMHDHLRHLVSVNCGEPRRRHGDDRMVRDTQQESVKIEEVARDQKR
jgi:hypothetical protein